MAKLTLRKRSVYSKPAHETNRFVKADSKGGRREYVIRSDNVLLRNDYWRSGYDGSAQSSGWKVVKRGIDPVAIIETLVKAGFTQ